MQVTQVPYNYGSFTTPRLKPTSGIGSSTPTIYTSSTPKSDITVPTEAEVEAEKKKKKNMIIGIVFGVIVIGVVLFLVFKKKN